MTNLKQKIESALKNKSLEQITHKAKNRFEPKTFAAKYQNIYSGTPFIKWCFSLFSIVTGLCFFMSISTSLNLYVSVVLGLGLYVLLELIKAKITDIALTEILQKELNIISLFSTPIAIILFGLSVYCSVYGIQSFYTSVDTTQIDLQALHNTKLDSINTYYQNKIEANKEAKKDYIDMASYKGKLNLSNKTNRQLLSSFDTKETNLLQEQKNNYSQYKKRL